MPPVKRRIVKQNVMHIRGNLLDYLNSRDAERSELLNPEERAEVHRKTMKYLLAAVRELNGLVRMEQEQESGQEGPE